MRGVAAAACSTGAADSSLPNVSEEVEQTVESGRIMYAGDPSSWPRRVCVRPPVCAWSNCWVMNAGGSESERLPPSSSPLRCIFHTHLPRVSGSKTRFVVELEEELKASWDGINGTSWWGNILRSSNLLFHRISMLNNRSNIFSFWGETNLHLCANTVYECKYLQSDLNLGWL